MKHCSTRTAEVKVSLQGSLETFAIPDVLVLLSSTKKDGELAVTGARVEGKKIDGKVWLEQGQIVFARIGAVEAGPVDAIFELLRLGNGDFVFEADAKPPSKGNPVGIDGVLADAQVRLGEWNDIAKVVPHLDAMVDMAVEAPNDEVIVSRDQWALLRRVAGGRSVHDLMVALGTTEFDTCKTVKELVDSRLASIDVDAKPVAKVEPKPEPKPEAKAPEATAKPAVVDEHKKDEPADSTPSANAKDEKVAATKVDSGERAEVAPSNSSKGMGEGTVSADKDDSKQDELDALAELASRQPRKVRPSAGTEGEPATNGSRPAASKSPESKPVEEAKALVAQLAALSGDDEEAVAAKVTEHLASGGELPEVPDGDEPINRGLLLKFLSSVRN
jgi:hypothetical protein